MPITEKTELYFKGWNAAITLCLHIAEERAGGKAFKRGAAVRIAEEIKKLIVTVPKAIDSLERNESD